MPSFQHTQLGVHLAGAFGLMYLWASSAQVCAFSVCVQCYACINVLDTAVGATAQCLQTPSEGATLADGWWCFSCMRSEGHCSHPRASSSFIPCWCWCTQGIVDKYHFSKRWFYLYGECSHALSSRVGRRVCVATTAVGAAARAPHSKVFFGTPNRGHSRPARGDPCIHACSVEATTHTQWQKNPQSSCCAW